MIMADLLERMQYQSRKGMKIILSGNAIVLIFRNCFLQDPKGIMYVDYKTVVKCREEKYDLDKGLMMVLLKYIAPTKNVYHDIIAPYENHPKKEKDAVRSALLAYTKNGQKELDRVLKLMKDSIVDYRN